ncbi:MAG: response regulator [Syntrophobacterales bacterium]|nr:response regulator [Syntrophobacterales bacterium]
MLEYKKPKISSVAREKVFDYVIIPISGLLVITVIFIVFSHLWILRNQVLHKVQIVSTAISEFLYEGLKILNLYASKTNPFLSSVSTTTAEENFMLNQYFHDIIVLEKDSNALMRIIPHNESIKTLSLPLGQISTVYQGLVPPYYSSHIGTVVIGIINHSNPDYILLGELDLKRLSDFVRRVIKHPEDLFILDSYGNYITHSDIEKVNRQENIAHYIWFPRNNRGEIFTIGLYEDSWFIIGGKYNILGFWSFVLIPLGVAFSPTLYTCMAISFGGIIFLISLQMLVRRWLERTLVMPLELFSSYVESERIEKHPPFGVKGFFPFEEGEILEQSFEKAMLKLRERNRALIESEEKFRIISETAPVGIFLFQDDRILYVNKEGTLITEYSEEELLDIVPFWQIAKKEYQDLIAYNATRRQKGLLKEQLSYEIPIITKTGREKITKTIENSTTFKGRPCGIFIMIDMTEIRRSEEEKRRLEAQLQKSQRLESLGTLVAGVSHEFNNILHGISLAIEHLGREIEKTGDGSLIKRIRDINTLQQRAASVVRGLLDFSRAEGLKKQSFSLHDEIERVVRLCRQVFPRSIEIRTRFCESKPFIFAGEGQLEQVFLNLLNNAKDAIENVDRSGVIEITTELTTDENSIPNEVGSYVKIIVSDNGTGIPPDIIDKIFDPFFTTKPVGKGSGLGLSMVYGIVKQLEGSIICESRWGEGTTFTMIFPVLKIHCEKERVPSEYFEVGKKNERKEVVSKKVRILVIEDETTIRDLMAVYLRSEGCVVDVAEDPDRALSLLDHSSYDLIITDLGLPGIGGEGLLKELAMRQINTPIILASGYIHGSVIENYKHYGVTALLTKPFSVAKLKETVMEVLSTRKL